MQLPSTSKYKIQVKNVVSSVSETQLPKRSKCILGVSMSNPVFWRSSLETILSWMATNFDSSLILVGDYLQRLNEQISNGDQSQLAIAEALGKGDLFEDRATRFLSSYPANNVELARWKPFLSHPSYQSHRELLGELYESNAKVRDSIEGTAKHFVSEKKKRVPFKVSDERAIELSVAYLLEEMAVFSILIDEGWEVVLYPGAQLPLLMEIAKGEFEGIPSSLKKGTYVELKIRKK